MPNTPRNKKETTTTTNNKGKILLDSRPRLSSNFKLLDKLDLDLLPTAKLKFQVSLLGAPVSRLRKAVSKLKTGLVTLGLLDSDVGRSWSTPGEANENHGDMGIIIWLLALFPRPVILMAYGISNEGRFRI